MTIQHHIDSMRCDVKTLPECVNLIPSDYYKCQHVGLCSELYWYGHVWSLQLNRLECWSHLKCIPRQKLVYTLHAHVSCCSSRNSAPKHTLAQKESTLFPPKNSASQSPAGTPNTRIANRNVWWGACDALEGNVMVCDTVISLRLASQANRAAVRTYTKLCC